VPNNYVLEFLISSVHDVYSQEEFPELIAPIESDFFSLFGNPLEVYSTGSEIPSFNPNYSDFPSPSSDFGTSGIRYYGAETGRQIYIYVLMDQALDSKAIMDKYFTRWSFV